MKICFLMPSHWTGDLGGAEVQVKYIMQYLRNKSGHELHFLCRKANMAEEEGTPIRKIGSNMFLTRYLKSTDYFKVKRWLDEIRPDVIYTRSWSAYVGMAARWCRQNAARLVFHIAHKGDVEPFQIQRKGDITKALDRKLYEYGLRHCDSIIAQAAYQDHLLQQHYGRKSDAVISNFHPLPTGSLEKEEPLKIYWVANVKPIKRPECFVELARRCKDMEDLSFHMIGALTDLGYEPMLKEAMDSLPRFNYYGGISLAEVNQHLCQGHMFVNTSLAEGFPNTYIQAWLRRLPVLSLDVNPDGIIDQFQLGFHSQTMDQLEADVRKLQADPDLRIQMAQNGETFAQKHYSWDNCQKIQQILEQV